MNLTHKVASVALLMILSLPGLARHQKLEASCLNEVQDVPSAQINDLGVDNATYPLLTTPQKVNEFGSPIRNRTYLNARGGADLYTRAGMPVKSMTKGTVKQAGHWYIGTQFVVVETPSGALVRYGFLKNIQVKVNDEIEAGDLIAQVGTTMSRGIKSPDRLRIEMYENTETGSLSIQKPCINRRRDILNPNALLEKLEQEMLDQSIEL